jgi:ribulose-phosphate 3-epimerase
MNRKEIISTSILSADFTQLGNQISQAEKYGADWIHIDVMDGHFVPNITMGPFIVEACRRATTLPLDVHLMIERPEKYIHQFAKAGASGLTIHTEASPNLYRTLEEIKALGLRAGVAINPGTDASAVRPTLGLVDMVLVMTVNPGYSGQKFMPETMFKVRKIRGWLDKANEKVDNPMVANHTVDIQVDGGIDSDTLPVAQEAGANVFVSASAVFKHPQGIETGLQALKAHLQT